MLAAQLPKISADAHVDEPHDLWYGRLPTSLREQAPRRIQANVEGGWTLVVNGDAIGWDDATVTEARRLWAAVDRPNLMIKVPGTPAGLPAFRQLIGEGINVNVTLLFSRHVYEAVAHAYTEGLEHAAAQGRDIRTIASVARTFGGHATLVRAPAETRSILDVFEPQPEALMTITRGIKASFDPAGILNPGRMYAGI